MMRPRRSASAATRLANRSTTRGSSSPSRVSASRLKAPTGVFSSWLTLATKSRRMASRRCRSDASWTMATAPSTWVTPARGKARMIRRRGDGGDQFEDPLGVVTLQGQQQGLADGLLGQDGIGAGAEVAGRGHVAEHGVTDAVADDHAVLDLIQGGLQSTGQEGVGAGSSGLGPRPATRWVRARAGDRRIRPARLAGVAGVLDWSYSTRPPQHHHRLRCLSSRPLRPAPRARTFTLNKRRPPLFTARRPYQRTAWPTENRDVISRAATVSMSTITIRVRAAVHARWIPPM